MSQGSRPRCEPLQPRHALMHANNEVGTIWFMAPAMSAERHRERDAGRGLGAACAVARDLTAMEGVRELRDRFWISLRARLGDRVVLNGHPERRLPNTLNVSFVGHVGADILAALDGVAASTGSACHAGRVELSPVLAAMEVPPDVGMGAVRFSLGRETRADEISAVVERLSRILHFHSGTYDHPI